VKARAYVPPEGASGNGEDRGEGYVPPGVSGSEKPRFELIAFDDVRIDTAPAYRIKGILAAFGLCVVWGPPKCGKSFLVFDMVMHVALGWKYRGKKVRQGSVVYCVLEGCKPFKNRIEAFRQKWLAKHARPVPFHLMASPMTLVADHLELIASIKRQCPNPAVVVIDTLNRSLAGSESNDEDMSAYVKAADAIKDAFNCAVIIVHHCGHEGTRPRGHSSLPGALDVELAVKRNAADNIIAILELMKDGQQGEEWASRLTVVKVGTDDDGDEITSCVIEAVEGAAKTKGKTTRLPSGAKIALRALHEAIGDLGKIPPASNYIPDAVKTVTTAQWQEYAQRRGLCKSDKTKAQNQAFKRASEFLIAHDIVATWEPEAWVI
jgi:hypothetical protein